MLWMTEMMRMLSKLWLSSLFNPNVFYKWKMNVFHFCIVHMEGGWGKRLMYRAQGEHKSLSPISDIYYIKTMLSTKMWVFFFLTHFTSPQKGFFFPFFTIFVNFSIGCDCWPENIQVMINFLPCLPQHIFSHYHKSIHYPCLQSLNIRYWWIEHCT